MVTLFVIYPNMPTIPKIKLFFPANLYSLFNILISILNVELTYSIENYSI